MKTIKSESAAYFDELEKRAKKSRIYRPYQMLGLNLAEILDDNKHKALYIKLAKKYDSGNLLAIAKDIAEKKHIKNKGAYFMKVFYENKKASNK